jgi:hypothetical protein
MPNFESIPPGPGSKPLTILNNSWEGNRMTFKEQILRLLPNSGDLSNTSADELINYVYLNLYNDENNDLRDEAVFPKLPRLLLDIILLIELDTELNMNGVLGFLENSSGKYIKETIEVLERINAYKDADALKTIKKILKNNSLNTRLLNDDLQCLNQYEISNFMQTHRITDIEIIDQIEKASENFYLYQQEENVFDKLINYIETNKQELIQELNTYL